MQYILPHIAAAPHECYVEPFCGTCSVLLAKPRSPVEVVNDIDGELVNALRQIQHHPRELLQQLRFVANSRDEFQMRRKQPGHTEIQRAASYLYLNNISFAGDGQTLGITRTNGGGGIVTPASRIVRQVEALHARLERVFIERIDWQRCLDLYDSPHALFFCDPPYIGGSVTAYAAWTAADVQRLCKSLQRCKGRWIVTLNDSPEVRAIFAGCNFTPIRRALTMNNKKAKAPRYGEVVITP